MSKKSRMNAKTNKRRAARKMDSMQWIAIGVILLAVVLVAWIALPKEPAGDAAGDAPPVTAKQYDAPPPMTIDVDKQYFATIKMVKGGEFVIQLYPDKAPITVNNFVFLAREGYYDGTTFHRVLPDFMAQGGDPTGTGGGGPGYEFENENSDLTFDKEGVVAMANAGPDTNGSQFFVTFGPQEYLNGGYTIFGQVIEGMDVVMNIRLRDPDQSPDFVGDAIESITISEE
jgi:cyclophilin family peptidyl-prolyl cis-trans isomerase